MLLRSLCPNCGTKKEYIAEQVGQSSHCEKCGTAFILKANDGRVAWQIVAATLVVLFIIGGLLVRASWRANNFGLGSRTAAVSYDRHAFDDDDN
jgi:uncharacterized protein (DUF983 family)